jgi:hypothetical protein
MAKYGHLVLITIVFSTAAWAQAYPDRQDCEGNVRILEMRPVAGGNPSLANYAWDNYVAFCEKPPWNKMIGADTIQEVAKVIHPNLFK